MLPQLADSPDAPFPPVEWAAQEPNGLLAWGGDLHPTRLMRAYARGIFPWYTDGQPILWWSPHPRAVIYPSEVHISRRLRRLLRQRRFRVTADRHFKAVIRACGDLRQDRDGTWITPQMVDAYCELHRLGHAHSVEVLLNDELVGGIYGVAIGGAFFGESMFSLVDNTSKLALVHLCRRLDDAGFTLLDCQMVSPHLQRMGAVSVKRRQFQSQLRQAVGAAVAIDDWPAWFSQPLDW